MHIAASDTLSRGSEAAEDGHGVTPDPGVLSADRRSYDEGDEALTLRSSPQQSSSVSDWSKHSRAEDNLVEDTLAARNACCTSKRFP